jgi:hypothetical protein
LGVPACLNPSPTLMPSCPPTRRPLPHLPHLASWLVWSFFCAYLFTGGFFNILLHLQLYHRWRSAPRRRIIALRIGLRDTQHSSAYPLAPPESTPHTPSHPHPTPGRSFSMPSMLMATLQGLVSSILLYLLLCAPMGGYVVGRYGGGGDMAWFVVVAFFLASLFVTQVGRRRDSQRCTLGATASAVPWAWRATQRPAPALCLPPNSALPIPTPYPTPTPPNPPQLLMMVSLDTVPEANAWTSGPGRTILGIFVAMIAVNQARGAPACLPRRARPRTRDCFCHAGLQECRLPPASVITPTPTLCPLPPAPPQVSYRLSTGRAMLENLLGLAGFVAIASACLWRRLRAVQATWAEALLAPKGATLRCGSVTAAPGILLLSRLPVACCHLS